MNITKDVFFNQTGKEFFFKDPFAMADYARINFPNECGQTVKKADNVAAQRFQFNLRWDLERSEDFVVFEDEIDWLKQPGNDPEWVFAFNRMSFWVCLGRAYALTRDEKYAKVFVKQLRHWLKTVPKSDNAAWRSIEVGFRMEYWLKAIRYFEASPEVDDDVINLFCGSVVSHAEFLMDTWNPYNLMSNWGILANRGLFIAGAMLPETERTGVYKATAANRLSRQLHMQVYRDGTHWEQSPMYHNEMLKCFLDIMLLSKRTGISLPANIELKTRDMCYYSIFSAKPNHHEICMGDSDDIDWRDLITRAAALFNDGVLKSRAYEKPDYDSLWEMGETGLEDFEGLAVSTPPETDKAFYDSNNYYFRSGWDNNATFVHFHCGTLGAGHGHADKLHIDVFSRGEDVLADAGRYTYVFGKDRIRYKEPRSHNVIMADGEDYYVCKDSWECTDLTRGLNQRFFSCSRYGYTEGGHLAYIKKGVYINRRVIYLKPDVIVIADELYSTGAHIYNQLFHWGSTGVLVGGDNRYVYRGSRVKAEMVVMAKGLTTQVGESFTSKHYNREEPRCLLETSFSGEGFTGAFTVLALSDADSDKQLCIDKLEVKSTFKGILFKDSQIEALNITFGNEHYTVVVAHEEFASPTDTFEADGCIGFGSCVVFDRAAGEIETGTVLLW